MSGVRAWPIHIPPCEGESMSSWLSRLGALYNLSPACLIREIDPNGQFPMRAWDIDEWAFDIDCPAWIVDGLSECTRVEREIIQGLSLTGLARRLGLNLDVAGPELYASYIGQVDAKYRCVHISRSWRPWLHVPEVRYDMRCRKCHECQNYGIPLAWRFSFITTCSIHKCWLEPSVIYRGRRAYLDSSRRPPSLDSLDVQDICWAALRDGQVEIGSVGVITEDWFRALRRQIELDIITIVGARRPAARNMEGASREAAEVTLPIFEKMKHTTRADLLLRAGSVLKRSFNPECRT